MKSISALLPASVALLASFACLSTAHAWTKQADGSYYLDSDPFYQSSADGKIEYDLGYAWHTQSYPDLPKDLDRFFAPDQHNFDDVDNAKSKFLLKDEQGCVQSQIEQFQKAKQLLKQDNPDLGKKVDLVDLELQDYPMGLNNIAEGSQGPSAVKLIAPQTGAKNQRQVRILFSWVNYDEGSNVCQNVSAKDIEKAMLANKIEKDEVIESLKGALSSKARRSDSEIATRLAKTQIPGTPPRGPASSDGQAAAK